MPATVVVILGMTYRFLFLLLTSAHDLFLARRTVGRPPRADATRRAVRAHDRRAAVEDDGYQPQVYLAMISRGLHGDARLLEPLAMRRRDWVAVAASLGSSAIAIWAGR